MTLTATAGETTPGIKATLITARTGTAVTTGRTKIGMMLMLPMLGNPGGKRTTCPTWG